MCFGKPALSRLSLTHTVLNVYVDNGKGHIPAWVVAERNKNEEEDRQPVDLHDDRHRWFLDPNIADECFTELTVGHPLRKDITGHTYDELKNFALAVA